MFALGYVQSTLTRMVKENDVFRDWVAVCVWGGLSVWGRVILGMLD